MSKQELGVISPPEAIQMEGQSESPDASLQEPSPKRSDEYRQRMSQTQKRWWHTHPNAEKRRETMKQRWQDPECRKRMSHQGIKSSARTREKLRKICSARWQDPEYREVMRESQRDWWEKHPEAKEEISETMKKRWQDPEYRAMMLRAREVRRKMREANPRLLTPAAAIDQELWRYARTKGLIEIIIETGRVEEEEIARLEYFFEGKGEKKRLKKNLLDRFSIAVAQVAYDPLD